MRIHRFLLVGFLLLTGCATQPSQTNPPPSEEKENSELVSLNSALNHIRQSYILGCMEALKGQGLKNVYPTCLEKGKRHADAVEQFVNSPPDEVRP